MMMARRAGQSSCLTSSASNFVKRIVFDHFADADFPLRCSARASTHFYSPAANRIYRDCRRTILSRTQLRNLMIRKLNVPSA
jgi:hypothetical protein